MQLKGQNQRQNYFILAYIWTVKHNGCRRVLDRAIKREVEDYDDGAENVFNVGNGPNIEAPTGNNYGGDSDGDVEAHDYNESGYASLLLRFIL